VPVSHSFPPSQPSPHKWGEGDSNRLICQLLPKAYPRKSPRWGEVSEIVSRNYLTGVFKATSQGDVGAGGTEPLAGLSFATASVRVWYVVEERINTSVASPRLA